MGGELGNYSDDAAQTDPEKDALAVAPFAERLAEHLRDIEAPNGYVVGLSGEWGSGKTSMLNFTRSFIERIAPPREGETASIVVIDFRPWLVSGHQDLVGAFFKVLSEQLGRAPPRWKGAAAGAAKLGQDLTGVLGKVGWITSFVGGGTLALAAPVVKAGLGKAAEVWSKEPSLQRVYEELRDILAHSATKIVVVIDDIDRLQPGEIQDIMMMVKTVGQLPNVVYLLSYDRNVVWPALQRGASAAARVNFAEKLVQQEIALPTPGFEKLVGQLSREAAFLDIDSAADRWSELVEVALRRWLRTPRDVVRLANNMRFAWPVLRDHMEPVEYLAIEGVRTFDKALFDWIRDNAFFLFGSKRHSYNPDEAYQQAQRFKASLAEPEREHTVDIAVHFFPRLRDYFRFSSKDDAEKTKDRIVFPSRVNPINQRGVGDARVYDAYFGFYAPGDVVGRAALARFFAGTDDEETTYRALKDAAAGRRTASNWYSTFPLFEAVSARLDVGGQEASVPLLRAALRIYSDLTDGETGKEAAERVRIGWGLFQDIATHVPGDQNLSVLLDPGDHVSLYALTLIAEKVRKHDVRFHTAREPFLASVRERIQSAADEDRLRELPLLDAALTVWPEHIEDLTLPREWLARHIDELWLLPKLRLFFGEYAPRKDDDHAALRLGDTIPKFFDIGRLRRALENYLAQCGEDPWQIFAKMVVAIDEAEAKRPRDATDRGKQ